MDKRKVLIKGKRLQIECKGKADAVVMFNVAKLVFPKGKVKLHYGEMPE